MALAWREARGDETKDEKKAQTSFRAWGLHASEVLLGLKGL
jgi:hypothetical protein